MNLCFYCGSYMHKRKDADPRWRKTKDHVNPRCLGGATAVGVESNIVYACYRCNQDKANMTLEEYRAELELRTGKKPVIFHGEKHN